MADSSSPIIELALMNLKPEATIYEEGTEAFKTWRDVAQIVRRDPGCIQNYSGRHMEDPTLGVHIIVWSSADAIKNFIGSSELQTFLTGLRGLTTAPSSLQKVYFADVEAWRTALAAPCTEIFTALGAEAGFEAAVSQFVSSVDAAPPLGYRGGAVGATLSDEGEKGRVVVMGIGWDSKEAHLLAKEGPGVITDNISLLRAGRKQVSLYHVQLKEM